MYDRGMKKWLFLLLLVSCSARDNTAKRIPTQVERPFVIVVPSYNNDAYLERNLQSILSQAYTNYRVIYIDDASLDHTYERVQSMTCGKPHVQLIHNEENRKALHNIYKAVHSCANDEIIVLLDGDDWFAHDQVLSHLNAYYANDNVWMTYGQYQRHPDGQKGMCAPDSTAYLKKGKLRNGAWKYSHLRTFYAGLFNRIRLQDLVEQGAFFSSAWDLALMFPMIEMAREHAYFVPEVMYVYNYETPMNDAKIRLAEQERIERVVRQKPPYERLTTHPKTPFAEEEGDLIVFSYNRPMQLYALLESCQRRVEGFRKIGVIYHSDEAFDIAYEKVKTAFPDCHFFKQSQEPKKDFKPLVLDCAFGKWGEGASYIAFAVDDIVITDDISIPEDIRRLQETGAYGMFYRLGTHLNYCYMASAEQPVPPLLDIGVNAWQFAWGEWDWNYPNALDLVLYKKSDIRKEIESLKFTYPNDFEGNWSHKADPSKVGLCYNRAKIVNIPMNVVSAAQNPRNLQTFTTERLLQLFLSGLKVDVTPLYQVAPIRAPTSSTNLKIGFL